jgi:hypothetical protein
VPYRQRRIRVMNRREVVVWILLVVTGVALRFGFEHIPNFAPVAAIALFSGYFFHNRIAAIAAPLAVMLVTDWQIGGYQPLMMAAVYFGLALPVFFGNPLRRLLPLDGRRGAPGSCVALLGCAAGASLAFFLITNLAAWWVSGIYPQTAAGFVNCYVQALPFFRFTFAGDAAFAVVFFGAYAAYRIWAEQRAVALVTATR